MCVCTRVCVYTYVYVRLCVCMCMCVCVCVCTYVRVFVWVQEARALLNFKPVQVHMATPLPLKYKLMYMLNWDVLIGVCYLSYVSLFFVIMRRHRNYLFLHCVEKTQVVHRIKPGTAEEELQ